ncbi:hypothetical protein OK006_8581 [Actinobacteria bacterium OK006]|nr:hypothetical protein OK006_8581 [Actinobacteria bacterium OK006]
MLYDALVAESRRNDSLDDVRTAALDRVRWLVDLLKRQRTEFRRSMGHEYRRSRAAGVATQAEIDGRLAACADEEGRAAVLCLMLAACFDDTSLWQYDAEMELNGYRLREPRRIDWERQAEIAERAFLANGFFVLASDRQVEDLDEVVDLIADPDLVFVKLVALVGG